MKDGYIVKNFNDGEVSKEDLELINKLARRPLKSDEVYVFSLIPVSYTHLTLPTILRV